MLSDHRKTSNSNAEQQWRTLSPEYIQSMNHNNDPRTEQVSNNRYSDYDNRPMKPLDQNMLQSKLNQYPIETRSNDDTINTRQRTSTNSQQPKRTLTHLACNANRYSPKTTTHEPSASTAMQVNMRTKSNRNSSTRISFNRCKSEIHRKKMLFCFE